MKKVGKKMAKPIKISGLFLDYDGTISRADVRRNRSRPTKKILRALEKISAKAPLAMVTTKDTRFIMNRVPFASAWAACGGLDIQIRGKKHTQKKISNLKTLEGCIRHARKKTRKSGVQMEKKKDAAGRTVSFCMDWRFAKDPEKAKAAAMKALDLCKKNGMHTKSCEKEPFADVFPVSINKGSAVSELRKKLSITGKILYLGDSESDNPAFRAADMSIGVINGNWKRLSCSYLIEFRDMPKFFGGLIRNDMVLKTSLLSKNTRKMPG